MNGANRTAIPPIVSETVKSSEMRCSSEIVFSTATVVAGFFVRIFSLLCCRRDHRASNVPTCQCSRSITLEVQWCQERMSMNETLLWFIPALLPPSEIELDICACSTFIHSLTLWLTNCHVTSKWYGIVGFNVPLDTV